MPDPQTPTSLHQVVAAAGDASLDDVIESLYCDLELDGHLGIEGPDHEFGLVIKISPLYESMSPNPAWLRRTLVKYPTTLAEIYAIARRLDAEQIRVWEGEGDLGDQLGVPCD